MVDGFKTNVIADWAKRHLASGSAVISDGLACFKAVKEANCEHLGLSPGQPLIGLDHPAFNWQNTMIGNVENSLRAVAIRSERSILPRHLGNTASGLIIVLTSRACWLNSVCSRGCHRRCKMTH